MQTYNQMICESRMVIKKSFLTRKRTNTSIWRKEKTYKDKKDRIKTLKKTSDVIEKQYVKLSTWSRQGRNQQQGKVPVKYLLSDLVETKQWEIMGIN